MSKPSMAYKPGQWLFLNVPPISTLQWHPFTITSSPLDPYVSIHVRKTGDFTSALEHALQDPSAVVRIDGPYGAPAQDVLKNEIAVLIGAGIGVTPWISVLRHIWHLRNLSPKRLQRVEFIWVCKDTSAVSWFGVMLKTVQHTFCCDPSFLNIHIYLTQGADQTGTGACLHRGSAAADHVNNQLSSIYHGRPDFLNIFQNIRQDLINETYLDRPSYGIHSTVGIYFCGPKAMGKAIQLASQKCTGHEIQFRFRKEHF